MGDYCTSSIVCAAYITNSECSAGTCQCPGDHWPHSVTECRPGVALGGVCTVDIECQVRHFVPGSGLDTAPVYLPEHCPCLSSPGIECCRETSEWNVRCMSLELTGDLQIA